MAGGPLLRSAGRSALLGALMGTGVGALNSYLTGRPVLPELGPGAVGGAVGGAGGLLGERLLTRGLPSVLRPLLTNAEGPRATRGRVLGQIGDVLGDDELTTDVLRSRFRAGAPAGGPTLSGPGRLPLTLADVAGSNTLGRAGAAARTPGPSQNKALQMVELRKKLYPQFVMDAVRQHLTPTFNLNSTMKDLQEAKKNAAEVQYADALTPVGADGKRHDAVISDPSLNPILDRVAAVGGFKNAETIAKAKGVPAPIAITEPTGPDPVTGAPGAPGTYKLTGKQLDLIKQGLDDKINSAYAGAEPNKNLGAALVQLKHELLAQVDPQLPGYKDARAVFSDYSTSQKALEAGRSFDKGHVEDNLDYFNQLEPGDQDLFRVGMGQRTADMVGSAVEGTNPARKFFRTNDQLNKTAAFFPDQASYQAFSDKLGRVADMAETDAKIYANSATAQRLQEEDTMKHASMVDSPLTRIFSSEGGGDIWSRFGSEALHMMQADPKEVERMTAAELTKHLLNTDFHDNMGLLDRLDRTQRNQRVRDVLSSVAQDTATTAGSLGGATVMTTSPPDPADQQPPPPDAPPPGMAEGGRVTGSPLAQAILEQLTPEARQAADAARRSDRPTDPAGFWTGLLVDRSGGPTDGSKPTLDGYVGQYGDYLEAARAQAEASRQADEAYAHERDVGGSDEYAARRLAPTSETDADWSGNRRYLTPGGRAIDYGPGDEALPGSDELYAAGRATKNWLTGDDPGGGGWGDQYSGLLADRRAAGEHWRTAHPGQALATLAAPMLGYGALAKAFGRLPKLARTPATISALGAGYGFAAGEGGLRPRLRNAARGAALGVDLPGVVDRWTGM